MWPAVFWWFAPVLELDPLSRARVDGLEPLTRILALRFLASSSRRLAITSGRRSSAEQAALYAQGRTTPGPIVTHAPPGTSFHETGRAFDVAPVDVLGRPYWPESPALWAELGELGEAAGLKWGGRWQWPDRPHFERR